MSEQFLNDQLVDQLDEAISAIIAGREVAPDDATLGELITTSFELRELPRESFKLTLKEELVRSTNMSTTATSKPVSKQTPVQQTITPYLTVRRAEQLVDFVKTALGGVEVFRTTGSAGGLHAEVTIGESKLMIGGYETVEEMPTALHLYVPDADVVYKRALEAGATSVEEPVDQFYGDREAGVKDPTGNIWWIATHKVDPAGSYIPSGFRPITPFLHPVGAAGLIDFMKQAFGAEEISREASPEGMIHHATVRIGNSMIEMGEAHGDLAQPMPPALFMSVENVEASYERALTAGATSLQQPSDQAYGRTAWVKDNWENVWYLVEGAK